MRKSSYNEPPDIYKSGTSDDPINKPLFIPGVYIYPCDESISTPFTYKLIIWDDNDIYVNDIVIWFHVPSFNAIVFVFVVIISGVDLYTS